MLAFFSCLIAGAGAVALVTAGILLWKVWKTDQGVQMAESDASVEMTGTSDAESTCAQAAEAGTEESLGQVQLSDDSPLKKIVTSGKAVSEALKERPESVTLTQDNAAEFASIKTCEINAGTGKVEITVESPGIAVSDDKYYYLFNESTFAEGINDGQEAVVSSYKDSEVTFSVNLNRGESDSRLYDKFVVAVRKDGAYLPVSHARYITNPEAIASCSYAGMKQDSIKGLLIDPTKVAGSELDDLGVNYATYNIPLARILGGTSNGAYPTITYSYDGVTYHFNGAIIHEYDYLFETLNAKGIDIAAIILNNASTSAYGEFTHPSARSGSTAPYYMFNAADESGVKALSAVGTFLASRYSGSGHGNVSMWIIGNEVNARKEWNYMAYTDLETYTAAYTRAFRVFYNAIRSVNAGAKVYMPLDQQWDRNWSKNPDYDGRDMLDLFASSMRDYGDISWNLAQHPYSYPNDNTAFWKTSDLVTNSADTSMITMNNIDVLTDYMAQKSMLNSAGKMRSIILSEMGYSSTSGQELQAAAFAYAYKKMVANGHIDAMMLSRQTDASDEIAQFGLALGLDTTGGAHKYIYNVYKYIDTDQSSAYADFAKAIVGKNF
jgi:hypothetical protein